MAERFTLHNGSMLDYLPTLAENSIDALVTDPPYGLGKLPDAAEMLRCWLDGREYSPGGSGFMGRKWDAFVPGPAYWKECLRVLKPGAHALVFAGTRTADLIGIALRLAGFEIRDSIDHAHASLSWYHGSGFPKSLNVSATADRCLCHLQEASSVDATESGPEVLLEAVRERGPSPLSGENLLGLRNQLGRPDTLPGLSKQDVLTDLRGSAVLVCAKGEVSDASSDLSEPELREGVPAQDHQRAHERCEVLHSVLLGENARGPHAGDCGARARGLDGGELRPLRPEDDRTQEPLLEGRGHLLSEARELQADQVSPLSAGVHANGAEGRLRDGASARDGEVVRSAPTARRSRSSRKPRPATEPAVESGAVAGQPEPQAARAWPTCGGCGKPIIPNGLGTALKPAHEPIIVARKPLIGTVAENLEKHGTGALNIDACRVAHANVADLEAHKAQVEALKAKGGSLGNSWKNSSDLSGANDVSAAGRWPANLLLSHSDGCQRTGTRSVKAHPTWDTPNRETESTFTGSAVSQVRHGNGETEEVPVWECVEGCPVLELDRQSGELGQGRSPEWQQKRGGHGGIFRPGTADPAGRLYDGRGTASRFFPQFQRSELDDITPFRYAAKPSRGERDNGLDYFRHRSGAEVTGSKEGQARLNSPRSGAGRNEGARNVHPTVKGIELMRWLVRLVTPPGGLVLDPFTGSGTTGVAAMLEGLRFAGCELNDTDEEPFVSIATARMRHVLGLTTVPRESIRTAEPPRQGALF